MNTPLSSSEEAKRLAALDSYNIVDSLPEQDYEDITQLAAQICGTPVALITLVDRERQWFKSNRGLSFRETPREASFCAHNLLSPTKPLVVPDARLDERFQRNALVTGDPHIVFYAGEPLLDEDGLVLGSLCVIDSQARQLEAGQLNALRILSKQAVTLLTARRKAILQARLKQQLDTSEARFENLVMVTPAATAIFTGRDMYIQQVNAPMLAIWGKDASMTGKLLSDAMPELEAHPFLAQLQHVFDTGEPFQQAEGMAKVLENGQLKTVWFNQAYNPLYTQDGQIYGVINTAIDVTPQVVNRRASEASEAALQNAIELAELGTWSMAVDTEVIQLSPRHADMFGLTSTQVPYEQALALVHPDDLERVRVAFLGALQPGSSGKYAAEYRIINAHTGNVQLIRARGATQVDEQGQPMCIAGTAQDITPEWELQGLLEQQVQQRTQELAASNEELLATNEAFANANQDLIRSNQNLEQFAYIASHDLQEPLRKIQQFGDLLNRQYSENLGEGTTYLQRMQLAASRMSLLIKDLLTFSRIATTQAVTQPVALNEVVHQALESLSVATEESRAQITVMELPTVQGDPLQLSQLFQNLLSNALKFRRTSSKGAFIPPQVVVQARLLTKAELLASVKPSRDADAYHLIEVIDNGVGFEEKYLDRIFQVFQRLHGTNEFAGTGVGLAIVQKVVTNHGGAITATSGLNQGATFSVYLPT